MPLPDALPDRRIYELLKTVDLENLTFSDFQKVAQTIYAEQGAEDELRRIVLLNLARLSVAGEWTGLTSAGSDATFNAALLPAALGLSVDYPVLIHSNPPYGQNTNAASPPGTDMLMWPFVSPNTGTVAQIRAYCVAGVASSTVQVGIYNDGGGYPTTLIGYVSLDTASSGLKIGTVFSSPVALEAGKQYWYSCLASSASVSMDRTDETGLPSIGAGPEDGIYFSGRGTCFDTNQSSQVSSVSLSGCSVINFGRLGVGLKF